MAQRTDGKVRSSLWDAPGDLGCAPGLVGPFLCPQTGDRRDSFAQAPRKLRENPRHQPRSGGDVAGCPSPPGLLSLIYLLFLAALGPCCCSQTFSSCGDRGLPLVAGRRLLTALASPVAEQRVKGSRAAVLAAQLPRGTWDLSGSRIDPVSPALAGGFLTTGPPGKPSTSCFFFKKSFSRPTACPPPRPHLECQLAEPQTALRAQGPSGVSPASCHW